MVSVELTAPCIKVTVRLVVMLLQHQLVQLQNQLVQFHQLELELEWEWEVQLALLVEGLQHSLKTVTFAVKGSSSLTGRITGRHHMAILRVVLHAHHKKHTKLHEFVQFHHVVVRARVEVTNKEILCLKQVNRG